MIETVSIVSNVWIKQIELEHKGDAFGGHAHTFDHQHLLAVGSVEVEVDGVAATYIAPSIIYIEKGCLHSITAVTERTVGYCIHPIREGYRVEDIIDPSSLPKVHGKLSQPLIDQGHKFIDTPVKRWDNDEID